MTVSYTAEVATSRFGCFLKLLLRWRASIYKLIWMDLLLFLGLYYTLSLLYRFAMNDQEKYVFESIVFYCHQHVSLIPLSFVLGFYVAIVMERWWNQYITIPWPDAIAVYVSALVRGQDERGRLMRRTIMRYVCLSLTMMLTTTTMSVKKRFPTLDHLIDAGLLVESEKVILMDMNEKFPKHSTHWMPIVWASSIVIRARKEGRIWDDFSVRTIVDELNKFRGKCGSLLHYDWISIPLVYTQVVTLAVYTFFLGAVFGNQWTDKKDEDGFMNQVDHYFPIFPTLQFFFYMGWLKVAESLINPFGEDDDDFEVNWMIDRNLQVSYLIVDEMHHEHPVLVRDQYWDDVFPNELPYPEEAEVIREEPPIPSTTKWENRTSSLPSVLSEVRVGNTNSRNLRRRRSLGIRASLHDNWSRVSKSLSRFWSRGGGRMSRMHLSRVSSSSEGSENEENVSTVIFDRTHTDLNLETEKEPAKSSTTESTVPQTEQPIADEEPKKDDFELLKEERERERFLRQRQSVRRLRVQAPHATPSQSASRVPSRGNLPRDNPADKNEEDTNGKQ